MQTFYQYATGIVLLSVAVSVLIYRDSYGIALYVSRYVSYRMTAYRPSPRLKPLLLKELREEIALIIQIIFN